MAKIQKCLAALISMAFILALLPALSVGAATVSISSAEAVSRSGEILVTVATKNLPKNAVLMAVSYDENGALLETARVVNKKATLGARGVFDVKVLCWSSLKSMKPLCAAVSPVIKYELDVVVSSTYLYADVFDKDKGIRFIANSDYSSDEYSGSRYVGGLVKGDSIDAVFDEGDTDAAFLLGYACRVSVGYDKAAGRDVIFEITPVKDQSGVTTVGGDMYAPDMDEADDRVYYWENSKDDNSAAAIELDENVRIFENYVDKTDVSELNPAINNYYYGVTQAYAEYFEYGGGARFIDNDGDGDADYVLAEAYTAEAVIGGISEKDGRWSFALVAGHMDDYDENDTSVYKRFIKNGKRIDVSELAVDDTVTAVESENGATVYYVSSTVVNGRAVSYDGINDIVGINGKYYGLSPVNGRELFDYVRIQNVYGKEGKFHINTDGLIAWFREDISGIGQLGYVTGITEKGKYNTTVYEVNLIDGQGRSRSYPLSDGVIRYYYGGSYEMPLAEEVAEMLGQFIEESPTGRVIRYQLTNGSISQIYISSSISFEATRLNMTKGYDSVARTLGGVVFNKNARVFVIDPESDYTDPKNIKVGSLSTMLENGRAYKGWAYGDAFNAQAVLITGEAPEAGPDAGGPSVFVVAEAKAGRVGGNLAINVRGFRGGEEESLVIYDPADPSVAGDFYSSKNDRCTLAKGTVLLTGTADKGYVNDVEVILRTWAHGDGIYSETPEFDAPREYTDESGRLIVQDMAYIDIDATMDLPNSDRVVLDRYLDYGAVYRPDDSTTVTVVDARDTENVVVKAGRARHLHDVNPALVGLVYFRAVGPDSGIDSFDIQENSQFVTDIVLYLFGENDYQYIPW